MKRHNRGALGLSATALKERFITVISNAAFNPRAFSCSGSRSHSATRVVNKGGTGIMQQTAAARAPSPLSPSLILISVHFPFSVYHSHSLTPSISPSLSCTLVLQSTNTIIICTLVLYQSIYTIICTVVLCQSTYNYNIYSSKRYYLAVKISPAPSISAPLSAYHSLPLPML